MPSTRASSFDDTLVLEPPPTAARVFEPSDYQRAIYDWFANPTERRNLIVQALAGSGKTTTILGGINLAPEQNILLAAFNKRIQEELAERLDNPSATAMTLHSLGYRAIRKAGGVTRTCTRRFDREDDIAEAVTGGMPYGARRLVGKLCTLAREIQPLGATQESLENLAYEFGHVPGPGESLSVAAVAAATLRGLHYAKTVRPDKTGIDYADMIYLPLACDWLTPDYDMVCVDEAQDMTVSQLTLALRSCKPGGRIVLVGDSHQAIYGFRGADSRSLSRLKQELDADERPLSKTYRCPRKVVAIAQTYVPKFEVDADAPAGTVDELQTLDELVSAAGPGDFVLSRRKAPLARVALRLLRAGKSAKIQGRDIGASLKAMVRLIGTGAAKDSIPAFLAKLTVYEMNQIKRYVDAKQEDRVDELADRCETLRMLAIDAKSVPMLTLGIDGLFVDDLGQYVICSTVHKAKGLETSRVFTLDTTFFMPTPCKGCRKRKNKCKCDTFLPDESKRQEEVNIYYVAITRAKSHLTRCMEKF